MRLNPANFQFVWICSGWSKLIGITAWTIKLTNNRSAPPSFPESGPLCARETPRRSQPNHSCMQGTRPRCANSWTLCAVHSPTHVLVIVYFLAKLGPFPCPEREWKGGGGHGHNNLVQVNNPKIQSYHTHIFSTRQANHQLAKDWRSTGTYSAQCTVY